MQAANAQEHSLFRRLFSDPVRLDKPSRLPWPAAWRRDGFVGLPWGEIFQSNSKASLQERTGFRNLPQKVWMVLDPVIEPIVLRLEPDKDAGGSTVPSNNDFSRSGQAKVLR